jgi:hypothetical protein
MAAILMLAAPGSAAKKDPGVKLPSFDTPMRVYIVRSTQEGCEPNCPEWIAAQGQITAGTLSQFRRLLGQLGDRKLPILIHSGGGLADEALAIGELVRKKGLDVAVSRTDFACAPNAPCRKKEGKQPLHGSPNPGLSVCASACAFILAAGTRRYVHIPAFVGVHRGAMIMRKVLRTYRMTPFRANDGSIRYRKELIEAKVLSERHAKTPDKIYGRYEKFFLDMGIDKDIVRLMLATPNDSIHWLTNDELRSTHLATHRMDGDQLVRGVKLADDGWSAPAVPVGPVVPLPGEMSLDCTLQGANCAWTFDAPEAPAATGTIISVAPMASMPEGPPLPVRAARPRLAR